MTDFKSELMHAYIATDAEKSGNTSTLKDLMKTFTARSWEKVVNE